MSRRLWWIPDLQKTRGKEHRLRVHPRNRTALTVNKWLKEKSHRIFCRELWIQFDNLRPKQGCGTRGNDASGAIANHAGDGTDPRLNLWSIYRQGHVPSLAVGILNLSPQVLPYCPNISPWTRSLPHLPIPFLSTSCSPSLSGFVLSGISFQSLSSNLIRIPLSIPLVACFSACLRLLRQRRVEWVFKIRLFTVSARTDGAMEVRTRKGVEP